MQTKQDHWTRHVDGWRSSGLSQAAYCSEHGLSLASFGYWRRRLARPAESPPTGLLPIRVASPSSSAAVEVRLPNGLVLVLPGVSSSAGLSALVQALAAC